MIGKTDEPLSNLDMDRMIKEIDTRGLNWVQTPNIDKHMSLKDLFGTYGHLILWHPWRNGSAHWIVVLRNKDHQYLYFDSFGSKHDVVSDELLNIIRRDDKKARIFVNDVTFQSKESAVCGRYCLLLIGLNKIFAGDFSKIDEWLQEFRRRYKNTDNQLLKTIYG